MAAKDFYGGELDSQWCTLGGLYLQYLHSYNELNGIVQLDNFSKFFSYPPHLLPEIFPLSSFVNFILIGGIDYLPWYLFVLQDLGQSHLRND